MQAFDTLSIPKPWLYHRPIFGIIHDLLIGRCLGFQSPNFLIAPRGVLLLGTGFTFNRAFFLETGCADVETQTHPRLLGL